MTEQYGEFSKNIAALDAAQEQVETVWQDETARSYNNLNNNIKLCTQKIWTLFCDSTIGIEAVKKIYDPDMVDKEITRLGIQVEQV